MSINFHAFQNRGYLLSGFEVICNQWRGEFAGFDPDRSCEILGLRRDETHVYMSYYGDAFRLRLADGVLERQVEQKADREPELPVRSAFRMNELDLEVEAAFGRKSEDGWSEDVQFNEAMALYHYLRDVKEHPGFAGVWIPNYSLDPRAVRKEDVLGKAFARFVAGRMDLLAQACKVRNGREIPTKGDLAFEFESFPQVPVQIHYYEEDDDFPAQVQMLVDRQVTDYLHLECTGCLFADLFDRLEQEMGPA